MTSPQTPTTGVDSRTLGLAGILAASAGFLAKAIAQHTGLPWWAGVCAFTLAVGLTILITVALMKAINQ